MFSTFFMRSPADAVRMPQDENEGGQKKKYHASGGRTSSSRDYVINGREIIPKIVFLCRIQLREKKR